MGRFTKDVNGFYIIKGKKYNLLEGSRAQVYHGTAYETSGGLTKNDLFMNKHNLIVSKKKHFTAKKEKRLIKNGYGFKKGQFGYVKLKNNFSKKGGFHLTPSNYPSSVGGNGNMILNPSQYPETIGTNNDPQGLGSISQQSFLLGPNNTPNDIALLAGGKKRKHKKQTKKRK
jgi:hypothetical protein